MLEARRLSKQFGGLHAVQDASFEAFAGEVVGIIGPNGAGKTTLFNLISGFIAPDRGSVSLDGRDVSGLPPHRLCIAGMGRTFQITKPYPELTVFQSIRIGALVRHRSLAAAGVRARAVVALFGLHDKQDRLGRQLSVMERKRLELARAYATGPKVLLLDEIAAGLRPNEIAELITLIRLITAEGIAIVMIEHVLEAVVQLCKRSVALDYGRVIARGTPAEVLANADVRQAYLGGEHAAA